MAKPEVWLRGPVEGIPALLQPVAHSLLQCREELDIAIGGFTAQQIWESRHGSASIGYHVRHAAGSLDRLFTYARGAGLSEAQLTVLRQESVPDPSLEAADLLAGFDAAVERALDQLRSTDERTLTDARSVGRSRLPSTVIGLLFHGAEHTQRHAGQVATLAKMMSA
ncbi:MAG TPA: DinB family protein [Vicinamibacterales bacterium]|nr:DinB family protein [Vicinamibacterales bacterium]